MSPATKVSGRSRSPQRAPDGGLVESFAEEKAWAAWLKKHSAEPEGLWIRFFKKDSGVDTVTYAQALDEALCWGWIDGPLRPWDGRSWIRRFTPRRPRSTWSKRNQEHVERLTKAGRMQPQGLAAVAAAKADGRWDRAYDPPSALSIPGDFLRALGRSKKAKAFFATLNRASLYAISYRLQTAKKPETRARRFEQILALLEQGKALH